MHDFIVSLKVSGKTITKKIHLSANSPSDLPKLVNEKYFNAKIVSYIQK